MRALAIAATHADGVGQGRRREEAAGEQVAQPQYHGAFRTARDSLLQLQLKVAFSTANAMPSQRTQASAVLREGRGAVWRVRARVKGLPASGATAERSGTGCGYGTCGLSIP